MSVGIVSPEVTSPAPDREYPIFRKRFHIPTAWAKRDEFQKLTSHTYASRTHVETMQFVGETLTAMGYKDASVAMKHDYLCFLMEDVLTAKGKMFLSERDLREEKALALFIGNSIPATPDLFLSHNRKWHLLDVYTGDKPEADIKSKYKQMAGMYTSHVVNTRCFRFVLERSVPALFSPEELTEMENNFAVFETEWQYWRSCFQMGQILFNSKPNVKDMPVTPSADLPRRKQEFKEALLKSFTAAAEAAVAPPD